MVTWQDDDTATSVPTGPFVKGWWSSKRKRTAAGPAMAGVCVLGSSGLVAVGVSISFHLRLSGYDMLLLSKEV